MTHRLAILLSALALLVAFGATEAVAEAAIPTHASQYAVGSTNVRTGSAAAVPAIFCAENGKGYCLNRNRCGTGSGTNVIMWFQDYDSCEDFVPEVLHGMCSDGTVTQTCPFTVGSGLNSRYVNQPIVRLHAYNENKCLATTSGGLGILNTCPDGLGNGGSNGTIFVWTNSNYVINRYWSDYNYSIGEYNSPSWMCIPGAAGQQVIVYDDTGSAGSCQWNYP